MRNATILHHKCLSTNIFLSATNIFLSATNVHVATTKISTLPISLPYTCLSDVFPVITTVTISDTSLAPLLDTSIYVKNLCALVYNPISKPNQPTSRKLCRKLRRNGSAICCRQKRLRRTFKKISKMLVYYCEKKNEKKSQQII